MFRVAGHTAGPIETKLDTRTHVQLVDVINVQIEVNVKKCKNVENILKNVCKRLVKNAAKICNHEQL